MRFEDKVVWVTGASGGIGEAVAKAFAAEGAKLVLSARRPLELEQVRDACDGANHLVLPMDVADIAGFPERVVKVHGHFGHVDILVHNAGVTQRAPVTETSMDVYRRMMEVNYFGPVALTKLVLPRMIERGAGHVVAVTSVAGKYGSPVRSGYNAAKHAMHGFFEALWAENARHGIDVTMVVPGSVRTQISVNALTGSGAQYGKMNRMQAQGMPPERVADRLLDAVAKKKLEILVADGIAWRLTMAHRYLPFLWRRMIRLT